MSIKCCYKLVIISFNNIESKYDRLQVEDDTNYFVKLSEDIRTRYFATHDGIHSSVTLKYVVTESPYVRCC